MTTPCHSFIILPPILPPFLSATEDGGLDEVVGRPVNEDSTYAVNTRNMICDCGMSFGGSLFGRRNIVAGDAPNPYHL